MGVAGSILAARILQPATFGLYAIGWTLLRFLMLIVPLGMDRAILRFGPQFYFKDPRGFKGLIKTTVLIAVCSGVLFGISQFLLAPILARYLYKKNELEEIFRLFAIAIPLVSILVVTTAATRISLRVKLSILIQDLGQPLLGLVLMIAFTLLGMRLIGVIASDIVSFCVAAAFGGLALLYIFPGIQKTEAAQAVSIRELMKYSVPAAFGGAFSVYILWVDRIIVGMLLPSAENGIYLAVSQISTIFLVISAGINIIAVPMFSNFFMKKDMASLEEVYKISTKWGIYFSVPILIVLLVSPVGSIDILYGSSYVSGALPLTILLVGQAINLFTGSINPLLIMTGNEKAFFRISVAVFALSIVLNLMLVPRLGLVGASLSTGISLSILYIFALIWGKYKLGFWPFDRRYVKGLIATISAIIAVVAIKLIGINNDILGIVIQAFTAVIVFIIVLLFLKLDPEDIGFLRSLNNKLGFLK